MPVMVPHLTAALLRRDVIHPMRFLLANFLLDHLPSASCLMSFLRRMSAAASEAVVLHSDCILSLFEGKSYLFAPEDVSVKVLTENLSGFIIYLIL